MRKLHKLLTGAALVLALTLPVLAGQIPCEGYDPPPPDPTATPDPTTATAPADETSAALAEATLIVLQGVLSVF